MTLANCLAKLRRNKPTKIGKCTFCHGEGQEVTAPDPIGYPAYWLCVDEKSCCSRSSKP